ncbi:MAG: hypothetical protein IT332_09585 [Ardenticatenales bacterium]|nr:hypothetical protein [Ardenticatenales bacterium]
MLQRLWRARTFVIVVLISIPLVLLVAAARVAVFEANDWITAFGGRPVEVPSIWIWIVRHELAAAIILLALALFIPDTITIVLKWLDRPQLTEHERGRIVELKAQCGRIAARVTSSSTGVPISGISKDIEDAIQAMGEFRPWRALYDTAYKFLIVALSVDTQRRGADSKFKDLIKNVSFASDIVDQAYWDVVSVADGLIANTSLLRRIWLSGAGHNQYDAQHRDKNG